MATYNCDTGFFLVGDNSTTCTGNGSNITGAFDGLVPICEAITCPPLSNPTNGSVSYSNVPDQNNSYVFNVMATYRCNSGFALVGNNTRNCSGDGSSITGAFDGEDLKCEVLVASSASLIRDVVIPVVSVVAVLALVVLGGAVSVWIHSSDKPSVEVKKA
ncbi:E-selectin-like [Halichondria panicea]|uniref:E-selectin-like n=1 Tax=Halichondria panicea TaxID=6063 RepID=UPI00312BB446